MNVLVFGGNGWIGQQLIDELHKQCVSYQVATSRVGQDSFETVVEEIKRAACTHVVCSLGRTHDATCNSIDMLEGGPDKLFINLNDNLYAPLTLAAACKQAGVHMTYIGTGCIYAYDETHPIGGAPFSENDPPNFTGSSYSVCKTFTERLLREQHGDSVLILRIRMPVTNVEHPRNFITKIATYKRVIDIPNAITYLPNMLPAAITLMRRERVGVINFVNPGTVSHTEVLNLYKQHVNPSQVIDVMTLEEQSRLLAAGRSNCALDTSRLLQDVHVLPASACVVHAVSNWVRADDKKA